MKHLSYFIRNERGQGLSEYSIVLGIIAVAMVGLIAGLSDHIVTILSNTLQVLESNE
jgi:pilus assembly protein Flp/PilA